VRNDSTVGSDPVGDDLFFRSSPGINPARWRIAPRDFPDRSYQKSPRIVDVSDPVEFIDKRRKEAKDEWQKMQ